MLHRLCPLLFTRVTIRKVSLPIVKGFNMAERHIKIYTKTGDKGTSLLFNMERIGKESDYFEALGDTDELNSQLGVAREYCAQASNGLEENLAEIQSRLLDLGSHLATPIRSSAANQIERAGFQEEDVVILESWIDELDAKLPPLRNFILPSGGLSASSLHLARTIARRAERHVVPLVNRGDANPVALRYLNRLSDFLFVAARTAAQKEGYHETVYKKAKVRSPSPSAAASEDSRTSSSAAASDNRTEETARS
jgi:cob(I)alamin adenosyltransferase